MFKKLGSLAPAIAAIDRGAANALEEIGKKTDQRVQQGFDSGTDALGRPWQPLQPDTIKKTGSQILVDTGDMRNSFEWDVDRSNLRLEYGSSHPLVPIHEYGAPVQNIPRRPILAPAGEYASNQLASQSMRSNIALALAGARVATSFSMR